jgi:hypothetical protein
MEKAGEHGLGVGVSIGRLIRVRPLLRFEAEKPSFGHSEACGASRKNPLLKMGIATGATAPSQ